MMPSPASHIFKHELEKIKLIGSKMAQVPSIIKIKQVQPRNAIARHYAKGKIIRKVISQAYKV